MAFGNPRLFQVSPISLLQGAEKYLKFKTILLFYLIDFWTQNIIITQLNQLWQFLLFIDKLGTALTTYQETR